MAENKYSLKLTAKASDDLEQIYSYISGETFAKNAADNLLARIERNIMRLRDYPFSFAREDYWKNKNHSSNNLNQPQLPQYSFLFSLC